MPSNIGGSHYLAVDCENHRDGVLSNLHGAVVWAMKDGQFAILSSTHINRVQTNPGSSDDAYSPAKALYERTWHRVDGDDYSVRVGGRAFHVVIRGETAQMDGCITSGQVFGFNAHIGERAGGHYQDSVGHPVTDLARQVDERPNRTLNVSHLRDQRLDQRRAVGNGAVYGPDPQNWA